ncbi:MAG: signal peptidase II [Albidovulum sp.]
MRLVAITAAIILALDQASKFLVVHMLDLGSRQRIDVLDPWLNLRMAWNSGINFGLFSNSADLMRWALVLLALAIVAWVWIWVRREPHKLRMKLSAGVLIGGAIGNVFDRIFYGAVADFLNMSVPGIDNPYSFNVADIAIFVGAVGLVIFTAKAKTP